MEKDIKKITYIFDITENNIKHSSIKNKDLGDPHMNLEINFQLK